MLSPYRAPDPPEEERPEPPGEGGPGFLFVFGFIGLLWCLVQFFESTQAHKEMKGGASGTFRVQETTQEK